MQGQNANPVDQIGALRTSAFKVFHWVKLHPVLAILLILVVWILLEFLTIPYWRIWSYRTENPGPTGLMQSRYEEKVKKNREGKVSDKRIHLRHTWMPLRKISNHLVHAVIV